MKKTGLAVVVLLLALFAAFASPAFAAEELLLAEKGKTEYAVRALPNAELVDKQVAVDLVKLLKEITGADFSNTPGKTRAIHIGTIPPCDKVPLEEDERRITTYNGDLYLYGKGTRANANAVYGEGFEEIKTGVHLKKKRKHE